jgi:hypothetical protein
MDDNLRDNLQDAHELSVCSPVANATDLQPYGYSRHHTLAHVAVDHEAVLQSPNTQWNSRSHLNLSSKNSR